MRTIKARLKSLSLVDSKIKSKRLEIASLRSGILTAVQYTDEPRGGSQKNSSEELNARIIDKTEEIYQEIERIYDDRDRLVKAIDNLEDPLQSQILRLKYVNGYSWSMIYREFPLHSRSTLFDMCKKGEQLLEKSLDYLD